MMTELRAVACTSRSATFEIRNGHPWCAPWKHRICLNGAVTRECAENVFTLHGLAPGRDYHLNVHAGTERHELAFCTLPENGWLDVRNFGACGDGRTDCTTAIQAAIRNCPETGVIHFPPGEWLSAPVFLRSGMSLHLARDARLIGHPDIERWPVLPAFAADDEGRRVVVGSWEGVPAECHAGLVTGIGVEKVCIFGEGCIDGNASFQTWWSRPRHPFNGWRPRLVYLVRSADVTVQGVSLRNSPSWTLHCLACRDVIVCAIAIAAPGDSPNTDGINPESCENVRIIGARVTTGDDCIGIKSGKRCDVPHVPARRVLISNCLLESGHGAVVIGSEVSGGVYDVLARDCLFRGTDRGLRIKTRRGRGPQAVVEGIRLENTRMERVGTPFVVNSFYHCDADGRGLYVADRRPWPVDEGTPTIRDIAISNVHCEGAAHSAAFVLGLPERPLEGLRVENYRVQFDPAAMPGRPDMAEGIQPMARSGIYLCNTRNAVLRHIRLDGVDGPEVVRENAA